MPTESAQFASESEKILPLTIVEWLLAKPVSREEQTSARAIEYGKRKHTVYPLGQRGPPFLIAMNEDFCVRVVTTKDMPPRLKVLPQLAVIIDFAIEDDADLSILVPHRLMAACDIKDREALMAKEDTERLINKEAPSIRAAMREHARHGTEVVSSPSTNKANQTTH
jgi:hypothetical protein